MKKIDKYLYNSKTPTLAQSLKKYKKLSQSFREQPFAKKPKGISPLSVIIPFAAASLSPFGAFAQCNIAMTSTGTNLVFIDIDNDGTDDFRLQASIQLSDFLKNDLFLNLLHGNVEVLANDLGFGGPATTGPNVGLNYHSALRFTTNDPISSANANWVGAATLPNDGATLDYQSAYNWHGSGLEVGYVGVRLNGNRLGFIEVSWDNPTGTITVNSATMGVQEASLSGATSVGAGICSALPVELIKFTGQSKEDQINLEWTTATEINNRGFQIERSRDGIDFRKVGWVPGQGNSNSRIDYKFEDEILVPGKKYFYRLKQLDFDGKHQYSKIVSVKSKSDGSLQWNIFPNPVTDDFLHIDYSTDKSGLLRLTIFDIRGNVLKEYQEESQENSRIDLDIKSLPAGSYFLKLEQEGNAEYQRFIKP